MGISNIDVEYEDETDEPSIRIYSSEQLDPATVVEQLDFKCIDSPNARCEYRDGEYGYGGGCISFYEGNTMIAFWHILIPRW